MQVRKAVEHLEAGGQVGDVDELIRTVG
ncbi:uncharacterized protein METZ01_LOCUS273182, partial [marine metagenome]